ncbi:MAG: hypothetical protein NT027_12120, partial [Proteobacteria bacterium]|nr:hypothetical protein [Pseudomonadota bacterium]
MAQDDVKPAYKPNLFSLLYKLRASGYKLRLLSFRSSLEEEYLIYFLLRKLHLIKGAVLLVIFFCLAAILGAWPFYEPPMSVKLMQLAVLSCIVAVYFILRTYTFYHHHKYIAHLVYLGFSVLIFFLLCVRSGDLQIAMIAFYFGYVMVVVALPAIGQVQFVALVNISISFIVASIYTG